LRIEELYTGAGHIIGGTSEVILPVLGVGLILYGIYKALK